MMFTPVNNYLSVRVVEEDNTEDTAILLPQDYRAVESPFAVVEVVNCSGENGTLWGTGLAKKKKIPTPIYGEYIKSPAWRKKKSQTYWCLGKVCEMCGSSKKIHVHHNNYEFLGSEKIFRDLVILCASCHKAFHKVVPSQELGKESVRYRKKCSLCMRKNKLTEYLSCSTYRRTKDQRERKKRALRICNVCAQAFPPPLLFENKNALHKEKLEQVAKKEETKRLRRARRLQAREEKARLLPPQAAKPKKRKKPKKPPLPVNPPEVLVRRKS